MGPFEKTRIHFNKKLPKPSEVRQKFGDEILVIYDRALMGHVPGFNSWMRHFPESYGVDSGEDLKALEAFPQHFQRIFELSSSFTRKNMLLLAVGGGSVGDFAGFVASIYKRGVRFANIPTTWLSALDSAHGGKTALNVLGIKNQIGSFYPAEEIFICEEMLLGQAPERAEECLGELLKILLISGDPWLKEFENEEAPSSEAHFPKLILKHLMNAIESKYKVISEDPLESLGKREVLNLGHTLGHTLETHQGIAHGIAVTKGLLFALEWSFHKKLLSKNDFDRCTSLIYKFLPERDWKNFSSPIPMATFMPLVSQDKKRVSRGQLQFVFLKAPGSPDIQPVKLADLAREGVRQGWVSDEN